MQSLPRLRKQWNPAPVMCMSYLDLKCCDGQERYSHKDDLAIVLQLGISQSDGNGSPRVPGTGFQVHRCAEAARHISRLPPSIMGIVQSFERGLGFWAKAAVAIGRTVPRTTRVTQQGDMGYGLQVTAPIEAGRNVAVYLLTGLSYLDPECAEPVVYSCDLPLVEACGPAVASWVRAAHQCPLGTHNTRVGMDSSEFHGSTRVVLADATPGHSKGTDRPARHYLDTHGMAGCFCNHSKDPNATISWTLVSAEDAPLHALVPTIVSLRRIEAGEFVMLDYGVRYSMDAAHCQ